MNDNRFSQMSRQRDNHLWDESRFDHPNHGDDLPKVCPSCYRAEQCFITDADGVTCRCGELIEGGE